MARNRKAVNVHTRNAGVFLAAVSGLIAVMIVNAQMWRSSLVLDVTKVAEVVFLVAGVIRLWRLLWDEAAFRWTKRAAETWWARV